MKLSSGCPNNCGYCYEPTIMETYEIPTIVDDEYQIIDMNLLAQGGALKTIIKLGDQPAKSYELVCGIDYRFLTPEIAKALKLSRFVKIRFAWDCGYAQQILMKKTKSMLINAGFRPSEISVFMLANWKIPFSDCMKKLDLLKVWNLKVNDCCFDGGYQTPASGYWTDSEIKECRLKCRKHNQLVSFGIDPEFKFNHNMGLFEQ